MPDYIALFTEKERVDTGSMQIYIALFTENERGETGRMQGYIALFSETADDIWDVKTLGVVFPFLHDVYSVCITEKIGRTTIAIFANTDCHCINQRNHYYRLFN